METGHFTGLQLLNQVRLNPTDPKKYHLQNSHMKY